jgi:hypothetical protein
MQLLKVLKNIPVPVTDFFISHPLFSQPPDDLQLHIPPVIKHVIA